MTQIAAHGLAVSLPVGWEGRILRRQETAGERTRAVVHCATFPLPEQRDDFGGGVTQLMRSSDVFMVLFEYGPESLGAVFAFVSEGIGVTVFVDGPPALVRQRTQDVGAMIASIRFPSGGSA